jgi:RHS repeat-associated protein
MKGNADHYKFTGKACPERSRGKRDPESNLDNFGARYYASSYGRFMSPDPSGAFVLKAINPQRWNMYSYTLNSPLTYTDPTGEDAIAVNFSGMVFGKGHEAPLIVDKNGSTTFASFGPKSIDFLGGPGALTVANSVQPGSMSVLPTVEFGANGFPTRQSMEALINALASIENVEPSTVRLNYFKTSEADTQALKNWVAQQREAIGEGRGTFCEYNLFSKNCADFTAAGLVRGNAITQPQAARLSFVPNTVFDQLGSFGGDEFDLLEIEEDQPMGCVSAYDTLGNSVSGGCE